MGDSKRPLSASFSRMLPAVSLLLTVALSAVTVCWMWNMQFTLNELRQTIKQRQSFISTPSKPSQSEILLREARSADQDDLLDDYLRKIAKLQLKSLQASCIDNDQVCVQGSKGEIGLQGSRGQRGLTGFKGDQGERGPEGPKGAKGGPGTVGSRIAAPVIVKSPRNLIITQGQTAKIECEADGYPKPDIKWHKVQSTLPLSRSLVNENGSLVIKNIHQYDAGSYACRAESLFGSATAYASIIVRVPPELRTVPPRRVVVTPGEKVVLRCSATGYPKPRVTWRRPFQGLREGSSLTLDDLSVAGNGTLTIASITEDDLGQYICEAKNSLSKATYSVSLSYQDKIRPAKYGVEVRNATNLQLQCRWCSVAGSKFSFTWEKQGGQLPENRTSTKGCSLFISKVTMADAGLYSCIGRTVDSVSETVLSEDITVIVIGAPTVTLYNDILTFVRLGDDVTFNCSAVGPPLPNVYWVKGSKKLTVAKAGSASLTVTSVTKQDEAEYVCKATNYIGESQGVTTLFIIAQPYFTTRPTGTKYGSLSSTISIDCVAAGQPRPKITWKLPCGQANERVSVLSNGTLVISQTTVWDTGIYQCVASSAFGSASSQIHVVVPSVDSSWMLSDGCSGWKQSRYNHSVYYAATDSNTWDLSKYYYCPSGYHWACTDEGTQIFKDNNNWSGQYTYYGQCSWNGYRYPYSYYSHGPERYYFRFRDSSSTNAHKHSGNNEEYTVEYTSDQSYFAGAVCIEN